MKVKEAFGSSDVFDFLKTLILPIFLKFGDFWKSLVRSWLSRFIIKSRIGRSIIINYLKRKRKLQGKERKVFDRSKRSEKNIDSCKYRPNERNTE